MAGWSQSHFLQSLGWATLNSFWQMALLWCFYLAASYLFKLNSQRKYQFSVLAVFCGFAWFVLSFITFFKSSSVSSIAFFDQTIKESNSLLNIFLISASIAYLSLLIFPAVKLFKNWQFIQKIKKEGLQKADVSYRLFVQKVAAQLSIGKKVLVYVSELVSSPLTIGYLKPIILLPVAALNNLSTQQAEAILLHELSHIKRYDYIINFIISIVSTILYFNPFVKQFLKTIEAERENCCDQLVLQFGYDKVSYASALLTLEKVACHSPILAMSAAGKKYLLNRIEKIVGMEKKNKFKLNDFAGILAALFCIVIFNSVLIIKEEKKKDYSFAYTDVTNPFLRFNSEDASQSHSITPVNVKPDNILLASSTKEKKSGNHRTVTYDVKQVEQVQAVNSAQPEYKYYSVGYDAVEGSLTKEEKAKVKSTVDATKKVLTNLQWKEVENNIADAMTECEKAKAKEEFTKEIDKTVNWKNIEQNMKAQYEKINWNKINTNIDNALTIIQLDSIQKNYNIILSQLDKAKAEAESNAKVSTSPLPDQSIEAIKKSKQQVLNHLELLKAIRNKKVVRL